MKACGVEWQAMSQQTLQMELSEHRQKWLKRLAAEIEKIESFMPTQFLPDDEKYPEWVKNVERDFSVAMLPAAKIRDSYFEITPKRMGALIGHMCEKAVWMSEWLNSTITDLAQGARRPINVVGSERRRIALRSADLPKQLIKQIALGVMLG